jgi:hypothetical protein
MSKIALSPNASGTGTFTFAAPGTNTDRTLTLPDASGTLATTADIPSVNPFTLGTAVASTSGTAIDFTGIPSWAKRVTVMLSGVSQAAPGNVTFQLGTSGGFVTSGYLSSSSRISSSASSSFNSTAGFIEVLTGVNKLIRHGSIVFSILGNNTWAASGVFGHSANPCTSHVGGSVALSGVLDRVRITNSSESSFDAGTINISYEG